MFDIRIEHSLDVRNKGFNIVIRTRCKEVSDMYGAHIDRQGIGNMLDIESVRGTSYGEVTHADALFMTALIAAFTAFLSAGMFFVF